MPSIPNVTRRGAVYQWRRRLPDALSKHLACSHISISLRIREQPKARSLAHHLNAIASMLLGSDISDGFLLTKSQVVAIFRKAADHQLAQLNRIAASERRMDGFDPEKSRRSDIIMSWVYRLLAGRGTGAVVDAHAESLMRAAGLSGEDMAEVDGMLAGLRRQKLVPTPLGQVHALLQAVGAQIHGGNEGVAQNAIYRGMAAALAETTRRWDGVVDEDSRLISEMLRQDADNAFEPRSAEAAPAPARSVAESQAGGDGVVPRTPVAVAVQSLASFEDHPFMRLAAEFARGMSEDGRWDDGTRDQANQTFSLFSKLLCETHVLSLEAIDQSQFSALKRTFSDLAKSYGKSRADHSRSVADLVKIGKAKPAAERGLESATVRRHFSFLQQFVEWLRAHGHPVSDKIQPSLLKPPPKERKRSKRKAMSDLDVETIFSLPPFIGCRGWRNKDAFVPGPEVFHRALYFAILMLHYMGARREEICGLDIGDVGQRGEIPFVFIRDNVHRTVKTHAAERHIPLHPEVIRLGFLRYVDAIRTLGYSRVFPDLHSGTTDSPSGDKLYDEFAIGLAQAIPDDERRQKVIHSLRKTFGAELKRQKVDVETRADLLGHAGASTTEEIYVEDADLETKREAMMKLPIVTAHLMPRPMNLIPWVANRTRMPYSGRKPGKAALPL